MVWTGCTALRRIRPMKIRPSPAGLAMNPDLASRTGTVKSRDAETVTVIWDDGSVSYLKAAYVEAADPT